MPDLGKYASDVLIAYGVSFTILAVLIAVSALHARKVKGQLILAERAQKDHKTHG
jgi:heme exporter protein D